MHADKGRGMVATVAEVTIMIDGGSGSLTLVRGGEPHQEELAIRVSEGSVTVQETRDKK